MKRNFYVMLACAIMPYAANAQVTDSVSVDNLNETSDTTAVINAVAPIVQDSVSMKNLEMSADSAIVIKTITPVQQDSVSAQALVAPTDTAISQEVMKKIIKIDPASFTVIDGAIVRSDKSASQSFAVPEFSQNELYALVLSGLTKMFPNMKKIATKVENESIEIKANGRAMANIDLAVIPPQRIDGEFSIKFIFKNGVVIVESPTVSKFKSSGFNKSMTVLSLKELGQLDPKGVKDFGSFINEKIDTILNTSINQ